MRFFQALEAMQLRGAKARPIGQKDPEVYYFWGDVLDIPCLKNSLGHEVRPNSWLMRAEWDLLENNDNQ